MSGTLLLTSPLAPADGRLALVRALTARGPVAAPVWHLDRGAADLWAAPVAAASAALDGPDPVVVVGVASGVLVALRLAVEAPGRVARLVLCTGARPVGTAGVRSVHRGVADLLPLGALRRLHGSERVLLQSLDLVRPLDHADLAPRVGVPALVAHGARDRVNRRPSEQLAAALQDGRVVALDGLGGGWMWTSPERLAALVG